MASVRTLRGKYVIDYRDAAGRRHREVAGDGKSIRRAEKLLAKRLGEIEAGTLLAGRKVRFEDYAEAWLEERAAKGILRPGTLVNYKGQLKKYLLNAKFGLGGVYLQRIDRRAVLTFQAAMSRAFPKLAPATLNTATIILGAIMQDALKDGLIASNPVRLVSKVREPHKEMGYLNPDEVRLLLAAAPAAGPDIYLAILLSIRAGLRRGELLALRWEDLDLDNERLTVSRSYRAQAFGPPKTRKSHRQVRLSPEVCQELRKARLRHGNPEGSVLIFLGKHGRPLDASELSRTIWQRLLRACRLRESLRWHDLRHTYASLMIAANASPKWIAEQMGHSSIKVTMDRYGHLFPDAGEEELRRLDAMLGSGHQSGTKARKTP